MSPRPSARTEVRRNPYKVSVEADEGRRRRRGAGGCRPKFSRSRHLSNHPPFIRKAVWALGNFSGAPPRCHGLVLNHEALIPLLGQLNEYSKLSMLRHSTRTLSNFCRGKPQPPFKQVNPAHLALEHLVYSNGEEVLTDACWAFSYLSDGTNDKIQAVIEAHIVPQLVELLRPSSSFSAHSCPSYCWKYGDGMISKLSV